MAQHQRKHYRRRPRFRFTKLYGVLSVLVILIAVVAGSIVFFRVSEVAVSGTERYTQEEIVAASGIQTGDNLFLLNKYEIEDQIETQLTYVDHVSIRRGLPSTIRVEVTECVVAAAMQDGTTGKWWLVSTEGKILEEDTDPNAGMQITGLNLIEPKVGGTVEVSEEQRVQRESLEELLVAMDQRGLLAEGRTIDVSGASVLKMWFADRLEVRLKLASDFDYQMRVLSKVMEEYVLTKWKPEDTGTLDITMEDGLPHLIKNAT